MKRILITGANGYVGRAFIGAFASRYRFRLFGRSPVEGSHEFVSGDIRNPEDVSRAALDVDAIVHLAAATTDSPGTTDAEYFSTNTVGTFNVLEAAVKNAVRKIVYGSSVCAVGFRPSSELVLETDPCRPTDGMYGYSKYLSERLCELYASKHGTNSICLRTAMIVPQHELAAPANPFASRWLGAVHIDDAIEALRLAVDNEDIRFGVFHVAADSPHCKFDLTKAKSELGYRPKHDLVRSLAMRPRGFVEKLVVRLKEGLHTP